MRLPFKIILFLMVASLIAGFMYEQFRPYGVSGIVDAAHVFDLAIQNKDISICDKIHLNSFADITNDELKGTCYAQFVKAFPDQSVCPRIQNRFSCVKAQAIASNVPNACLVIQDTGYRSLCVFYVAQNQNNPNICSILQTVQEQQQCVRYFDSIR